MTSGVFGAAGLVVVTRPHKQSLRTLYGCLVVWEWSVEAIPALEALLGGCYCLLALPNRYVKKIKNFGKSEQNAK